MVEEEGREKKVVFSGDLGPIRTLLPTQGDTIEV
jgi:hypothetical protein